MSRKVVKRSTHRVVGHHPSRKAGGLVPWESQIEQRYFEWLEVDPEVLSFCSQPRTFKWSDTRYTPDALVRTHQGSFFAEVKPDKVLANAEAMSRLREIERRLRVDQFQLRLVLASEIDKQPRRQNIENLQREVRRPIEQAQLCQLSSLIENGSQRLGDLTGQLGSEGMSLVLRCVAHGHLFIDLDQEITSDTQVRTIHRR